MQGTRAELLSALHLLQLLFLANGGSAGAIVPPLEFYCPPLCAAVDLGEEYSMWVQQKEAAKRKGSHSPLTELISLCQARSLCCTACTPVRDKRAAKRKGSQSPLAELMPLCQARCLCCTASREPLAPGSSTACHRPLRMRAEVPSQAQAQSVAPD